MSRGELCYRIVKVPLERYELPRTSKWIHICVCKTYSNFKVIRSDESEISSSDFADAPLLDRRDFVKNLSKAELSGFELLIHALDSNEIERSIFIASLREIERELSDLGLIPERVLKRDTIFDPSFLEIETNPVHKEVKTVKLCGDRTDIEEYY